MTGLILLRKKATGGFRYTSHGFGRYTMESEIRSWKVEVTVCGAAEGPDRMAASVMRTHADPAEQDDQRQKANELSLKLWFKDPYDEPN